MIDALILCAVLSRLARYALQNEDGGVKSNGIKSNEMVQDWTFLVWPENCVLKAISGISAVGVELRLSILIAGAIIPSEVQLYWKVGYYIEKQLFIDKFY